MRFHLLLAACLLLTASASAKTYYVSSSGDDLYPGSLDQPFKSISKAVGLANPGDTIYVRGDTFSIVARINISRSGASGNMCYLLAYPGERPLLDCSAMPLSSSNRGINLSGNYWYIKGIDIARAGDNGMDITGSYNVVEFCTFSGNKDTGLQLDNGASNNRIINCDSFDNRNPPHGNDSVGDGNADGFSPKMGVGSGNYFYGCRSWQNSDDGWDGYLRGADNVTTTLENCWCFKNGYLSDGNPSRGNGNGYKMGGSDLKDLAHNMILRNCLAFDNRVKGYDQNNNKGSMTLLNCTAYRNGTNYSVSAALDSGQTLTVKNCAALGPYGSLGGFAVQATNSWTNPFSVDATDFISIDTTGVRGPRKPDGSLPDLPFMRLASGSDLINAGTDVGIPYEGPAPDLGAFETEEPVAVRENPEGAEEFALSQNYPNPFNPETTIKYTIAGIEGRGSGVGEAGAGDRGPGASKTMLVVYDVLGRQVAMLVDDVKAPGSYEVRFDGSGLASGVYVYRLTAGSFVQSRTMLLLK